MRIAVTGNGTDVGKTVVSSILVEALHAEYWKPIQCGESSDTETVKSLVNSNSVQFHSPAYSLRPPYSPHYAAMLEDIVIDPEKVQLPVTSRPLVIETTGGILVPLTLNTLLIDIFQPWNCIWIVVSQHYLGSINHTLLTLEALKLRQMKVCGIIFNGDENIASETAILSYSRLPCLGRLAPELKLTKQTIKQYAKQWKEPLYRAIENF